MDVFNARSDSAPTFMKILYLYKRGIEGNSKTQPIQAGFEWTVFYQSSFKWNRSSLLFLFQIMRFLMWFTWKWYYQLIISYMAYDCGNKTDIRVWISHQKYFILFQTILFFFFSKFCWSLCKRAIVSCDSDKEHGK